MPLDPDYGASLDSSNRSVPIGAALGPGSAQDSTVNQMPLEVEGVAGGSVHQDKALSGTLRLEPLHFALSSTEGLMGDLGPVVLVNPLSIVGAQADFLERSPVRAQLVGRYSGRSKAVLLQELGNKLPGCGLVPTALLDQDLQHLALTHYRLPATGTSTCH